VELFLGGDKGLVRGAGPALEQLGAVVEEVRGGEERKGEG
jgi:hypothetical protein